MSNQNILGNDQALNSFLQQQTKHIQGQPVRVYPFKVVSGLSYFTNRGQEPLGTNIGASYTDADNTGHTSDLGAFSGITTMFSGSKPLIAYWFGVVQCECGVSYTDPITHNTVKNQIHTWLNANPLNNGYQEWEPLPFLNPITQKVEPPWKEVGITGYSISNGKVQHGETLDNLKIACYETVYTYTVYTNDWVPTFQEMNEFVYFILDVRCPCPIALRIDTVEPHYDELGVLQDCQITFESVNQYFNQNGRNVLTYVKFGAVGDGYAFPQEKIIGGQCQTTINMQLLKPAHGGVSSIAIKNNSLTGQFGGLIYGHPYVEFNTEYGVPNRLERYCDPDRYLLPYKFETPIKDKIDVASEIVHDSYDIMMNMLLVNEQIWGSWRNCKQNYNMTQNFTFQGGLAFDDPVNPNTNNVLYGAQDSLLNGNSQYNTWTSNNPDHTMLGEGYGSKNLGVVMQSNAVGYSLMDLCDDTKIWTNQSNGSTGAGFCLPTSSVWDYRGTYLTSAQTNNPIAKTADMLTLGAVSLVNNWFDLYYSSGFQPPSEVSSEILALTNASGLSSFCLAQDWYVLNSFSMINTHQLEINYRDGIVHTNQDQGENQWYNQIQDWFAGIADMFMGYVPGYADFFLNTYTRTYSLMIPHSLAPLCNQYMNPTNGVYNAIPLDIFANTNDNNTSVGQLKYMSGYQFSLTDQFITKTPLGTQVSTAQMRSLSNPNKVQLQYFDENTSKWNDAIIQQGGDYYNLNVNQNSLLLYKTTTAPLEGDTYVIDEVNIKQLGISNLHISYYLKDDKGVYNTVGEEWIENTAKMMNNTSYIDNDISYYVYDSYNTSVATNAEPYVSLQYPASPTFTPEQWQQIKQETHGDVSAGFHWYGVNSSNNVKGVNFSTSTYTSDVGTLAGDNPNSFVGNFWSNFNGSNFDWMLYGTSRYNNPLHSPLLPDTQQVLYSVYTIQNCSNSQKYISPTINNWWLKECSACSQQPDSDGYLPGSIKGWEEDGYIGVLYPWPGNPSNTDSDILDMGSLVSANTPSLYSVNYGISGTQVQVDFGMGLGLAQGYACTMAYYVCNFTYLLEACQDALEANVPVIADGSASVVWNYVLVPHGTTIDANYMYNWWWYNTIKGTNAPPWVNSKECVIIIEPNAVQNQMGTTNNPCNNVVLYENSYNSQYTPAYYTAWCWWFPSSVSFTAGDQVMVPGSLASWTNNPVGGVNMYSQWLNYTNTFSATINGVPASPNAYNQVCPDACPLPPYTAIGMGASFVSQYVFEDGAPNNPFEYALDNTTTPIYQGSIKSLSPLKRLNIQVPNWLSTNINLANKSPNNYWPNNTATPPSNGIEQIQYKSLNTLTYLNYENSNWFEKQSTFYNPPTGKYDFYLFYNVISNSDTN